MEHKGINYFRRQALEWKYPELEHGKGKDFRVYNMDRNPDSETYGQEKIDWNIDTIPRPTEEDMIEWYNQFSYLEKRKYESLEEQEDKRWHDVNNGLYGEQAKTGEWFLSIKAVKDAAPKPG